MKNAKITIGLIGLLLIGLVSVRKEGKVQEAGFAIAKCGGFGYRRAVPRWRYSLYR